MHGFGRAGVIPIVGRLKLPTNLQLHCTTIELLTDLKMARVSVGDPTLYFIKQRYIRYLVHKLPERSKVGT
jgi:hypothetical protein